MEVCIYYQIYIHACIIIIINVYTCIFICVFRCIVTCIMLQVMQRQHVTTMMVMRAVLVMPPVTLTVREHLPVPVHLNIHSLTEDNTVY